MPPRPISSSLATAITRIGQKMLSWLPRSPLICLLLWASLLLCGCVQSDLGIQFDSPTQGTITQRIHLNESMQSLGGTAAQEWLSTLEQRSRSLGGHMDRNPDQEWIVTLPFSNNADLEQKFNQFFSPLEQGSPLTQTLPDIESHLEVVRNNFLFFERNFLDYTLDLRSLGVISSNGDLIFSPGTLIDLQFRLKTPWGARAIIADALPPDGPSQGRELRWQLIPGEQNHLKVIFWLPNPLGIGTLAIALLVWIGMFLRYPKSPLPSGF